MSVSLLSLSGLTTRPAVPIPPRPLDAQATRGLDGTSGRVRNVEGQLQDDQLRVDQRGAEAARKATTAQQAAHELGTAMAAMTRDQATLAQAKSRANLDVYT